MITNTTIERFGQLTKALQDQGLQVTGSISGQGLHITIKARKIVITELKIITIYQRYGPVTIYLDGIENGLAKLYVKGFGEFKASVTLDCSTINIYVRDDWI